MAGGKIDILVEPDLKAFPGKLEAGLRSSTGIAGKIGSAIGLALGGGLLAAGAGFSKIISLTTEFEGNLNSLQAVTQATGAEMQQVSARAIELGNDITLPGTSASQAAEAMLELAKGGLTVSEAMDAAKGTLTLAAAAQVSGARAAEIQSDALNIFGLEANEASRVADILANSANASAVEITDVASSLKFVGPVAKAAGVSIQDTATAIALLGNQGIRGEQAGTALRGMLASLVSPSKKSSEALDELGVVAYDTSGQFVGFENIIGQLRDAQEGLTQEQYQGAIATAFGRETMSAVLALVNTAPGAWDEMSAAVQRQGGAQEVAAAKMKGLGGALEGFKSQLETTAITIGQALSPALEALVRGATGVVGALTEAASGVGGLADRLPGLNRALEVGRGLWDNFRTVLTNVRTAAEPVVDAIARLGESAGGEGGGLSAVATGLEALGNAAVGASQLLGPVGDILGFLVDVAGQLPGPVQAAALAYLAFKTVPGILSAVRGETDGTARSTGALGRSVGTIVSPITGAKNALSQFGGEMRVQRSLADLSGQSISRLASVGAAFETSTLRSVSAVRTFRDDMRTLQAAADGAGAPIGRLAAGFGVLQERSSTLSRMVTTFTTVQGAISRFADTANDAISNRFSSALGTGASAVTKFGGVVTAAGASLGRGLLASAGSLVGFLGGPWGVALAAAGVGLSILGSRQQDAARSAQEHQGKVDALSGTLDKLAGSATTATRELAAQSLTQVKLSDGVTTLGGALARAGISAQDFVAATTGNQPKLDQLNATLFTQARVALQNSDAWNQNQQAFGKAGVTLDLATAAALGNVQAQEKMQAKLDAVGEGWNGLQQKVQGAIGPLGEIGSLLGAQAGQFNEAAAAMQAQAAATQDFNQVLGTLAQNKAFEVLKNGGAITEPMRAGFDALSQSALRVATDAGKTAAALTGVEGGAIKARESMQASRDSFVQAATSAGLTAEQANALANQIGLIPTAAETIFRTNATGVAAELITLKSQFDAIPGSKSVTVQALTDEAKARLTELGFTVTTLPDGTVQVTANTDQAKAGLDGFISSANSSTGTPKLDANRAPADAKLSGWMRQSGDSIATATLDANRRPADAKTSGWKSTSDRTTGTSTQDANRNPADAKTRGWKGDADRAVGTARLDANDGPARSTLGSLLREWGSRTLTWTVNIFRNIFGAEGMLLQRGAGGEPVAMMAQGGQLNRRMTPMSGSSARIVKPNTWRVIGDRMRDDEAFIPINRSKRSQAIFELTAQRMGYQVARMYADGGLATQRALTKSITQARMAQGSAAAGGQTAAIVAQLAALRSEIADIRSVTYAPTINNPRAETPAASTASALRTASALKRI
jgi:TP901 family phage tail tape measure protein